MTPALVTAVEELIAKRTGNRSAVTSHSGVGGGCISQAHAIELADGRHYFLKWNPAPLEGMFERECEGLDALAAVGAIRVPQALGTGGEVGTEVPPFVVMEAIGQGRQAADFFTVFGHQFATLHRHSVGGRFGFEHDNYLGATPQPNRWERDACEFWKKQRLGFQLRLARQTGADDPELRSLGERLMNRLDDYLGAITEPPSLLHGDLWSGNFLTGEGGEPVLIDPACYCGHREADLAMTMLFGGFGSRFYSAYEEVWPLEEGSSERLEIYKLYHLLNHLNLFGSSYRGQCVAILQRLV